MSRGSDAPAFPSTRWSRLQPGPGCDSAAAAGALEDLALRYWRPICAWARVRWARSDEEAAEIAQDFFVWLMESEAWKRADRRRGRFRAFVKTCLANFVHDRGRRERAQRRGGGRPAPSLVGVDLPDPGGRTPEQMLDDLWRKAVLSQAVAALKQELQEKGKEVVFAVFDEYYISDESADRSRDYADVAARHGLETSDVSNHLMLAKRRFRVHLKAVVLDTVHGDEELRAELAWLFDEVDH